MCMVELNPKRAANRRSRRQHDGDGAGDGAASNVDGEGDAADSGERR